MAIFDQVNSVALEGWLALEGNAVFGGKEFEVNGNPNYGTYGEREFILFIREKIAAHLVHVLIQKFRSEAKDLHIRAV